MNILEETLNTGNSIRYRIIANVKCLQSFNLKTLYAFDYDLMDGELDVDGEWRLPYEEETT